MSEVKHLPKYTLWKSDNEIIQCPMLDGKKLTSAVSYEVKSLNHKGVAELTLVMHVDIGDQKAEAISGNCKKRKSHLMSSDDL